MKELSEVLRAVVNVAPVVHTAYPDPGWVSMDFTERNTELTEAILQDTDRFSDWVSAHITGRNGRMGIGGYAEHRTIYRFSSVFDPAMAGEEPRRLHLGVDIWAPAGTPVHCPLDAKVHSFSDQDRKGDYGAVIILQHEWQGVRFHTLYGHLSKSSLDLFPGKAIAAGDCFAHFGSSEENGHWPPHLHFQVIGDMGGRTGDYPGVCRYSEREHWLANSPDPELILRTGHRAAQPE
jgi:murein DD-endopeptidase MepM/ murein hydrolase activator NlpD